MISPNAGLSVSFSVISAKPIRHKIIETPNFFSGFLRYTINSKIGVVTTESALMKPAFDTDV